ncbi:MAG: TIGR04282 family arsenosugar biosynthesis glycosyltransferase [Planctomycetes bacterium]|nr:TIGR04282 family arsenosugar biosynthesis glycosyltransferase [Planctomycetota bacterium]
MTSETAIQTGPLQVVAMLGSWPEIGRSKTRLAAAIGGAGANQVYRRLLRHCADAARRACSLPNRKPLFFVDPPERVKVMQEWLGGDQVVLPQDGGDPGRRMRAAADRAFDLGAQAVVIMGSDCPRLTPERIERAFEALASQKVVIGPAHDGGFYLLGLTERIPALFRPMQWHSDRVVERTRTRCRRLGIEPAELETLHAVDGVEDLTDEVLERIGLTRAELAQEPVI